MEKKEINKYLKESEAYIHKVNLMNVKLSYSFKLLSLFHLTVEEKIKISEEFDKTRNEIEVIDLYDRKVKELSGQFPDPNIDYRWSPGFAREMMKYIKHHKEYDPFKEIEGFFKLIKSHFTMTDNMDNQRNILRDIKKANVIEESIKQNIPKVKHAIESITIILKDVKN